MKTIFSSIKLISYKTTISQSLADHTTAIITPNKIGEYGAKASFFKKCKDSLGSQSNFLEK